MYRIIHTIRQQRLYIHTYIQHDYLDPSQTGTTPSHSSNGKWVRGMIRRNVRPSSMKDRWGMVHFYTIPYARNVMQGCKGPREVLVKLIDCLFIISAKASRGAHCFHRVQTYIIIYLSYLIHSKICIPFYHCRTSRDAHFCLPTFHFEDFHFAPYMNSPDDSL